MRRRQIAAMRAQEVAVTFIEKAAGVFLPIPEPTAWPDADGVIAGRETCPKCGKVMKPQGVHNHVRFCKGDV